MRGYGSGSGGSGVIFSNVNVEDPRPTMQTFFECMTVPAPNGSASRTSGDWAGTVFKNVSIAATNHNYQPEILWGNTNAQIHDLTFDNFSIAGQKVLSNPFTTNAYVYNLWFTNSDTTAPLVSGAPASGSFAAPFTINLGVDENYGYYSTNGISWHQFSPITGAAIYVGDTTSLSVYGQDVLGNNSGTNTYLYTYSPPLHALATQTTPAFFSAVTAIGGNISLTVGNATGTYVVQASTNLADANAWHSLYTNAAPFTFTDSNATSLYPQRFYRVTLP
jgi:hypothetical protein